MDERTDEVFADAPGVPRGKESSRDNKRNKCDSDCGSASEDDKEKMKRELLDELRKIMREEMKEVMKEAMKEAVREEMKEVMNEVMKEAVREELKPVIEMIAEVKKKVVGVEEQMRKQTDEVISVRTEVSDVKEEMRVWKEKVEKIEDRVIDQQARSMRNNMVVYGLGEEGENENCERIMKDLIKEKCGVTRDIVIERPHRIPTGKRPAGSKPRPMICRFPNYNDRQEVMRAARKNLPRGINVADDLPPEVRAARKLLVPDLKQAKDQGKQAWIAFPSRLIIDNVEVKAIRPASVMSPRRD